MSAGHDILFLRQPLEAASSNVDLLREQSSTLEQLRQALHAVVLDSRSTRKEARQWLINALAALDLQEPGTKRRRFMQFLPGGAACRGAEHTPLALAALQLLFETAPAEVGALVAQDASLLRHFFRSDPKRVPLWFGHFSHEGMRRFRFGAAALAQYALAHRAEMWSLLEWQGRHPQAPVAVAQRPHYFCELDVPRTLRHLLSDCPHFWASPEMRQSVEAGAAQLLGLDPGWWGKELLRLLEGGRSATGDRLHALLCRCLERGSWRLHCQRLLQTLPQPDLLPFAADVLGSTPFTESGSGGGGIAAAAEGGAAASAAAGPVQPGAWLVFLRARWASLDQLLLAAALGCSLPQLLRVLEDDDMAPERQQIETLARRLLGLAPSQAPEQRPAAAAAAHWRLRQQLAQQGAAAGDAALPEALLLHLFAAAIVVQQLATSGSDADAQQLQALLGASGLCCQLEAPRSEERQGRRSSSSSKRRKHKRRSSSSRRHKQKGAKRRRRSGGGDSASSGSSDSEAGRSGAEGDDFLLPWSGAGEEASGHERLWRLRRPGGSSGEPVSGLAFVDAVVGEAAWAHARWMFGRR